MKTIGMLGGMSWEATARYCKLINDNVRNTLGEKHSAKICLYNVDFYEIEKFQQEENWDAQADVLSKAAKSIEAGGADFIILCVNTIDEITEDIEQEISIPLLHVADAIAQNLIEEDIQCVGFLGTRFTMEEGFHKERLKEKYNIDVLVPEEDDQDFVHKIIFSELSSGKINPASREECLNIIQALYQRGADAVILGCTKLPLLLQQEHTSMPLYNTAQIYAQTAVKYATVE